MFGIGERGREALRILKQERALWDQRMARLDDASMEGEADLCAERYAALDRAIQLLEPAEARLPHYIVFHPDSTIPMGVYQADNSAGAVIAAIKGHAGVKHGTLDGIRAEPIAAGDEVELTSGASAIVDELSPFSSWLRIRNLGGVTAGMAVAGIRRIRSHTQPSTSAAA